MQSTAQQFNDRTINTCQTSANIASGMFPKSAAAKQLICSSQGANGGLFGDWAQAQHKCNDANNRRDAFKSAKQGNFKDVLGDEFNLAWEAAKRDDNIDDELAELFMTITGTITSTRGKIREHKHKKWFVTRKHQEQDYTIRYFPSRINDEKLITAFLDGSNKQKFVIYKCEDNDKIQCLYPQESHENPIKEGFLNKVDNILGDINDKMYRDNDNTTLNSREQNLINQTNIPVYKIMAVQAAFRRGQQAISYHEFAETIAYDLFLSYLHSVLETMHQNTEQLRQVQVDDSVIKDFQSNIKDKMKYVKSERRSAYSQVMMKLNIIEQFKQVERQVINGTANVITIEG